MTLLLLFLASLAIGLVLSQKSPYDSCFELIGVVLSVIGVIGVLFCAFSIPVERAFFPAWAAEGTAIQNTIDEARESGGQIESAGLMLAAVKWNAELASKQHWNSTLFDLWIPDQVDAFKPIR